ncbi:MAG: HI1506-related protein [Desulfobacula sp.]|nr:HI1506-related protein [Desulfobacula sp.]
MIQIVSRKDGFRRGGVAHSENPKTYKDDHFTKDQLKAIEKEPMLIVTHLPDPPEKKKEPAKKDAGKKDKK